MNDIREQLFTWPPGDGGGPADQVGTSSEEREHLAVARRSRCRPSIDTPTMRSPFAQSRRRRGHSRLFRPMLLREPLTCRPAFGPAGENVISQIWFQRRLRTDVDRPYRTANRDNVPRIVDFLMAEKLRPCAVRSVAEIVRQLAGSMPSTRRLRSAFMQERKTRVRVTKRNHVAGENPRARASSWTFRGPSSSGDQPSASISAGVLPSNRLRLRPNQRRTPMSL